MIKGPKFFVLNFIIISKVNRPKFLPPYITFGIINYCWWQIMCFAWPKTRNSNLTSFSKSSSYAWISDAIPERVWTTPLKASRSSAVLQDIITSLVKSWFTLPSLKVSLLLILEKSTTAQRQKMIYTQPRPYKFMKNIGCCFRSTTNTIQKCLCVETVTEFIFMMDLVVGSKLPLNAIKRSGCSAPAEKWA